MPKNSEKMYEIIKRAKEEGAVDLEEGKKIYANRQSFYNAIQTLEQRGYLERKDAPLSSSFEYIWIATDKAEEELHEEEVRS